MALVSVIVPVYNVSAYLEKCIRSLQAQTLQDIEILLVDDGSTDGSDAICDRLAASDQRVTVFHQQNQGVSVARNTGLQAATGKWVTFVDADDWAKEQLCAVAVEKAEALAADILIFSYDSVFANRTVPSRFLLLPEGDITQQRDFLEAKTISQYADGKIANNGVSAGTTWGKLIRRSVIQEHELRFVPGLTRAQDTVFWLNAFEVAPRICLVDAPLYCYRISDTSICSGNKYLPECEQPFGKLLAAYARFVQDHHKEETLSVAMDCRVIQVLMWHLRHKIFHKQAPTNVFARVKQFRALCKQEPFQASIRKVPLSFLPNGCKLMIVFARLHLYFPYYYAFQIYLSLTQRKRKRGSASGGGAQ